MMSKVNTILFDLDGTLLDTAPDMAYALNQQRLAHQLPELELSVVRPHVGHGSRSLLKLGFDLSDDHPDYLLFLEEFLSIYQLHLLRSPQLFPEMERVLDYLDQQQVPWGIVTNKPGRFTHHILNALELNQRAGCIVCGDSLPKRKPHPDTILLACEQLKQAPKNCIYIGDNAIDVIASKAAGTKSLVALYGYIGLDEDPFSWHADGYVDHPPAIIDWLNATV